MRPVTRRQINRIVDGAVTDAMRSHPDFIALGRFNNARKSIVKRVVGALSGYLEQRELAPPKGGSGGRSARTHPARGG